MELTTALILFIAAVGIGVFAVVFGGTLFLSLPLFQILFPEMSFGALVGNIKLGSVLRNLAAVTSLRRYIDPSIWPLGVSLCAGSLTGAFFIASASPAWIPIALLVGLYVSERATSIQIPRHVYWGVSFLVGVYGGVLGAGIMLLIIALLQLRYDALLNARANAVLLELAVSLVAVLVFNHLQLIEWPIALVWAAGGIVGGYIGGRLLARTGKLSSQKQQWLLRTAFGIAMVVALYALI